MIIIIICYPTGGSSIRRRPPTPGPGIIYQYYILYGNNNGIYDSDSEVDEFLNQAECRDNVHPSHHVDTYSKKNKCNNGDF